MRPSAPDTQRNGASLWLAVRSGHDRGRTFVVAGEAIVVGRDEACDLVVDDTKVSRRHLSLERLDDGRVALRDLGSSNGTFVNGTRVDHALLSGTEQIQIGDTVLVSSREEPGAHGSRTEIGQLAGALHTPSGVQRLRVQRSLRRVTVLATAAVVVAAAAAVLLATGGLPGRGGESGAVQRAVRLVAPATVFVEARRDGRRVGTGSGWVLDGREGLVVTNAHVVNGGESLLVRVDEELVDATVVGVAPCEDLAVLRLPGVTGLPSLPLGEQSSLEQGETVVAVGYPANASAEVSLTSTAGVVSVVRTAYREPTPDVPRYANVVQTDAAFNPGNSGGPLVDLDARLVGVNSAARTLSPDGRVVQGQNYAIGVDRVREILPTLRSGHSIGWTGLGFGYPEDGAGGMGGLLVRGAFPGTSADRAGLGEEGDVLVAVNGMPVGSSLAGYCDAVSGARSGDRVTLSVLRPGTSRPRDVAVTLE